MMRVLGSVTLDGSCRPRPPYGTIKHHNAKHVNTPSHETYSPHHRSWYGSIILNYSPYAAFAYGYRNAVSLHEDIFSGKYFPRQSMRKNRIERFSERNWSSKQLEFKKNGLHWLLLLVPGDFHSEICEFFKPYPLLLCHINLAFEYPINSRVLMNIFIATHARSSLISDI